VAGGRTVSSINLIDAMHEMNLVDYTIIFFILLGTIKGYRQGLVTGLLSFFGWAAAVAASFFLSPLAVAWLDQEASLTQTITEIIRQRLPVETLAEGGFLGLSLPGLDLSGLEQYVQEVWASSPENMGGLADILSRQAATLFAHGVVFVILVVVGFLVFHLFTRFITGRIKGTMLGLLNRLGGMLFGTGVNIVIAALVIGLLTPWLVLGSWEKGGLLFSLTDLLSDSVIAPYFSALFVWVSGVLAGMSF